MSKPTWLDLSMSDTLIQKKKKKRGLDGANFGDM